MENVTSVMESGRSTVRAFTVTNQSNLYPTCIRCTRNFCFTPN